MALHTQTPDFRIVIFCFDKVGRFPPKCSGVSGLLTKMGQFHVEPFFTNNSKLRNEHLEHLFAEKNTKNMEDKNKAFRTPG